MKIICRLLLGFLGLIALLMLTPGWTRAAEPRTFRVNSAADTDDGVCEALAAGGHNCTLREAINKANAHPADDFIYFNIPACPCTIYVVGSGLPIITDHVTIDGYTQAGSHRNTLRNGDNVTLMIELHGGQAPMGTDGLRIQASNTYVDGLAINGFAGGAGIKLMAHPGPVKIMGNTIGKGSPNAHGIVIETNSNANLIGSNGPEDRNRIENNTFFGIVWTYTGPGMANNNEIAGNYVMANGGAGIAIANGKRNTIGGASGSFRNVINGNGDAGISIQGSNSTSNVIAANLIGVPVVGASPAGNQQDGILILGGASRNVIGGLSENSRNRIANNLGPGITIGGDSSRRNAIRLNSIYDNGGQGIDLGPSGYDGVTLNDPVPDSDSGANEYQNFPTLSAASVFNGKILGTLRSVRNKTFTIDIFMNPTCTPSAFRQGRVYLQSVSVTTNASGRGSFSVTDWNFTSGKGITATTTDEVGNTSEFSACISAQ